ncbi:hypothetical protein EVA_12872, partial [gut metagenome]
MVWCFSFLCILAEYMLQKKAIYLESVICEEIDTDGGFRCDTGGKAGFMVFKLLTKNM